MLVEGGEMMSQEGLRAIKEAIQARKANWEPKDNPIARLSPEEFPRRLGEILDEKRLQQERALPRPDMAHIVAKSLGIVGPMTGRRPVMRGGESADKIYKILQQSYIANIKAIQNVILLVSASVDYRDIAGKSYVTKIKDQGSCGSCVAHGHVATLESMALLEHGVALDLSEAELFFCAGGTCSNGLGYQEAMDYLMIHGVALEACFPYQDHDIPCQPCNQRDAEATRIHDHVTIFDVHDRKVYLYWTGPMIGGMRVYDDFRYYGGGVYSHVWGPYRGGHCFEIIGYDDNQQCWICKNSWGDGWGEEGTLNDGTKTKGFFRVKYGECDIDTVRPFRGISRSYGPLLP
jgi:hypothetical protein